MTEYERMVRALSGTWPQLANGDSGACWMCQHRDLPLETGVCRELCNSLDGHVFNTRPGFSLESPAVLAGRVQGRYRAGGPSTSALLILLAFASDQSVEAK